MNRNIGMVIQESIHGKGITLEELKEAICGEQEEVMKKRRYWRGKSVHLLRILYKKKKENMEFVLWQEHGEYIGEK